MPGFDDITVKSTTSSYQSMDGSNFTTIGYDLKFKSGVGVYTGLGTDFHSKPVGVIDLKECGRYGKDSILGQNLRVRTQFDSEFKSTQVRFSPCTVDVPVSENTSIYANPHYVGKYNYQDKTWTNAAGIFAGVSQKVSDNTTISLEVQRYNLQDIKDNSAKNWSINAIISVNL